MSRQLDDGEDVRVPGASEGASELSDRVFRRLRIERAPLIAVAVVAAVVLIRVGGEANSRPSPMGQLNLDWSALTRSPHLNQTASNRLALAATWDTFAGEVGALPVPSDDEGKAHKLVDSAIAVARDFRDTTYVVPTTPVGTTSGISTPPSYSSDLATLNRNFRALDTSLGGE